MHSVKRYGCPMADEIRRGVVLARTTRPGSAVPTCRRTRCGRGPPTSDGRWARGRAQRLRELEQSAKFSSIFGTIDLDLRQATLHGDVVEVSVFNFFGTVTVIVPEGITATVDGGGMFASQVIEPRGEPPVPVRRGCGSASRDRAGRCTFAVTARRAARDVSSSTKCYASSFG